jgi:tryptophan-rich sensory protein
MQNRKLPWWQVALLAVGVSLLGRLSSGKSSKTNRKLYNKKLKQAPWAPPAWTFAVAWPVVNFFLVQTILRLLQQEPSPAKRRQIVIQAFIWSIFFSFNYVYFNKKSSVLAAIWTMADSALAWMGFGLALKMDKRMAYGYLPLAIWTTYASTVGDYQALKNPDPVLETKALID